MKQYLQPHKMKDYRKLKTPMPYPRKVLYLENLRNKGFTVNYPRAPWYNDNVD